MRRKTLRGRPRLAYIDRLIALAPALQRAMRGLTVEHAPWQFEYCNMLFGATFMPLWQLYQRLAALGLFDPEASGYRNAEQSPAVMTALMRKKAIDRRR
jgi:hypothetical protein